MALFLPFPFNRCDQKSGVPSMALFLPFPFKGATKKVEFHPWHFFFPFPLKVRPRKSERPQPETQLRPNRAAEDALRRVEAETREAGGRSGPSGRSGTYIWRRASGAPGKKQERKKRSYRHPCLSQMVFFFCVCWCVGVCVRVFVCVCV